MTRDNGCPCYDHGAGCAERRPGCHAGCERFLDWKAKQPRPPKADEAEAELVASFFKRRRRYHRKKG